MEHIQNAVSELLEPYDENKEVEPYVAWTKDSAAKEKLERIEELLIMIKNGDNEHYNIQYCKEELARLKLQSDDEFFQNKVEDYDNFDKDGNPLTTYNPKSKWDWYEIGGRWNAALFGKEQQTINNSLLLIPNITIVSRIIEKNKIPFAIVTPVGEWHERGELFAFASVKDEKNVEAWNKEVVKIYGKYLQHIIVCCDCHI